MSPQQASEIKEKAMELKYSKAWSGMLLCVVAGITGCGSSPSTTGSTTGLAAGGATSVYAIQEPPYGSADTVLQFTAGGNGSLSPTSSFTTPSGFFAQSIVLDSTGQIYVGGNNSTGVYQVLAYAAGSTGAATPSRTITLSSPIYQNNPVSLSVDSAGNLYVVGFYGSVTEYSSTASGTAVPLRTITGTATTLPSLYCYGVAFDSAGNMYVSTANTTLSGGQILEFATAANGNVAPIRTITTGTNIFYGIAVDASGNIFAAEDNTNGTAPALIAEFSPTASGAATPTKTITVSGTTPSIFGGLRIDSVGNLYGLLDTEVGSGSTATNSFSVVAIGPNASGNIAPAAQLTSSSLSNPSGQIAIR
jgi:sugar lactone lactonase YvrE